MKASMLFVLLWGVAFSLLCTVNVITSSTSDFTITYSLPEFQIQSNSQYSKIVCPEMNGHPEEGYPDVPYQEYKIAVPYNGTAQVSIISNRTEKENLKFNLEPVPHISRSAKSDTYQYEINQDAYRSQRLLPWTISPVQSYRTWNYVSLRIYPFSYDHARKELTLQRSLTLQVHITGDVDQRVNVNDKLKESFLAEVLNGNAAIYWGHVDSPVINHADFAASDHWYSFDVPADGIYAITYNDLQSIMNIADVTPDSIRIFTTGGQTMSARAADVGLPFREVPLLVEAGNDGSFDAGDRILFYGQDRDDYSQNAAIIQDVNINWFYAPVYFNPYSQATRYWLTYIGDFHTAPVRITSLSSTGTYNAVRTTQPEVLKLESDRLKREPNPMGFHMYQSLLAGSTTASYSYAFSLENADLTVPQKVTTTLRQQVLAGSSGGTHYMGLAINQNTVVNSASFSADNYASISRTGNYCVNGNNQLVLTIYRTHSENIYLDYFKIEFEKKLIKLAQQQYRVNVKTDDYNQNIRYEFVASNPAGVKILKVSSFNSVSLVPVEMLSAGFAFQASGDANTRIYAVQDGDYLSVSNLVSQTPVDLTVQLQPLDNIIITPAMFKPQAEQLQQFYAEKLNASSRVVDVQDIYNQFNAGMPDPAAIRQYVRYCYYNYPIPALSSVTLLGVGTNDWRNQSGTAAEKNKMIVYQKILTYASELTSDDYFVMVSANNNSYPEIAIGRYPARSTAEMDLMLNRVIQYGSVPNPGWWRNTLLFFADDDVNGDATGEWIHSQYMESGSQVVNRSVLVDKIFGIDYDFDEFGNKPQARDDMIDRLNEGRLFWYYNGHGSYDKIGSEDYFNGFSDMGRLANSDHLPLFLAASCDVAEFDSYTFDCLAEKLLLQGNGGAIASFASTRLCYAPENTTLMNYLFDKAINQRRSIGESIRLAKFSSSSVDNDATYVLLGDPLLPLTTPSKSNAVTIDAVNNQLQARQTAHVVGNFNQTGINGSIEFRAYDSDLRYHMGDNSIYTKINNPIFRGNATANQGVYEAGFIVPDDIVGGNTARIISYAYDSSSGSDYVNYYAPLTLSGHDYIAGNPDIPNVKLYLETTAFRPGDQVSTNPLLYAVISDSTGINILGAAGHKILLLLDNSSEYQDVTGYFIYDTDSYTSGTLSYQLPELTEGEHRMQLIVFDNFNAPTVAETNFIARKSGELSILKMLPYPNPMKKDGMFTLVLTEEAQITLSIYTITGKKIRTLKQDGIRGYNQVAWDGKDEDGDYLANNTYLYKVRVKNSGKSADRTGQFIIYH